MTYDEIKSILKSRLGNRTDLDTEVEAELKLAQQNMEQNWGEAVMPYFMLNSDTISVVAGATSIPVPDGFIREYDEGMPLYRQKDSLGDFGVWSPAVKWFEEWRKVIEFRGASISCGEPALYYSIVGFNFNIYPYPTYDSEFELSFYASQPILSDSNQNNNWTDYAPELLIAAAGKKLATHLHDASLAEVFGQEEVTQKGLLLLSSAERMNANIDMVIGVT